jgi:hypothetical protein
MDINSGQPWSEMSIADLERALTIGEPIEQIADLLCRDIEEVRAKIAELEAAKDAGWRHTAADAVSAEIISFDGSRAGVSYVFRDGARDGRLIGPEDWPVIRKLKEAGKLSYCSMEAREGVAEIIKLGLDR